ncbi:hypothetical protein CKO28_09155 [Rhodovibrio sodomensis]|uniref:histidine kinase n=1 Tax=Rhodovibrio sodomensis TaxID=1088 RepID=A0ABS1DDB0_9PROT|nr:PAS domain-containing protein [Rhodovibrio sodomensis]MBK1668204.1 hypothetical protein [Rhodovibrio sodomensis]
MPPRAARAMRTLMGQMRARRSLLPARLTLITRTRSVPRRSDGGLSSMTSEVALQQVVSDRDNLRALIDTSHNPMIVLDRQGRVELWSRAATELFGWSEADVIGHCCPLVADDAADLAAFERCIKQALSGEAIKAFETTRIARKGEGIPLTVRISPRQRPGHAPDGVVIICEDMRSWYAMTRASDDEKQRFSFFAHLSNDWLWETDLQQRFTFISQHGKTDAFPEPLYQYIGRTRHDLLKRAGAPAATITAEVDEAMREGRSFEGHEYSYTHPERGQVYIRFSGHPFYDHEGRLAGYRGVGSDVTEARRAQASAQNLRTHLEAVAKVVPGALYQYRFPPDGSDPGLTFMSPRVRDYFGFAPEDVSVPPAPHWLCDPRDVPRMRESVDQTYRALSDWHFEARYQAPSGDTRWWRAYARPQQEADGAVIYHGFITDITEEKRARDTRSDAFLLLDQAASLAGLGYWIWDAKVRHCVDCSDTTAHLVGMTREAFLEHNRRHSTATKLMAGDDGKRYLETVFAAINEGRSYHLDFRVIRQDTGEERIIEEFGQPIFDDDGVLLRVIGSSQDVTAARREIDAAREGERRYRMLAEVSAQLHLITTYDAYGARQELWHAGRVPGIKTPDEYDGPPTCPLNAFAIPEDHPLLAARKQRFLEGRTSVDEVRLRTRGGDTRWVRAYGRPEHDSDGRLIRIYEACEDITEERRMRAALEQLDTRVRRIAENLPGAMYQLDVGADGTQTYTFLFGGFRHRLGLPASASPAAWTALIHEDDQAQLRSDIATAATSGAPTTRDVRFIGAESETLWVRSIARPRTTPNDDGTLTFDGVMIDITERRASEERVKAADKMESLGTLAGGIAHDFNNLLQSILLLSEDVLEDVSDPATRESLSTVIACAHQGRDLVRQVLAFARSDRSAPAEAMSPGPMVRDAMRMLRASLPPTVRIELDIEDVDPIYTNLAYLQQIVLNLVQNAAHACDPHGRVRVRLSRFSTTQPVHTITRTLPPGFYTMLSVEDNGSGISTEDRERIFDPFFSTKPVGRGSGLGLSVVLGHVQRQSGGLRLASTQGVGTRFEVLFPAVRQDQPGAGFLQLISQ